MLPLRDLNPSHSRPIVTVVLIALCVGVYLFIQVPAGNDAELVFERAAIPCEVVQGRPLTEREVLDTLERDDENACQHGPDGTRPVFAGKQVFLALLYSMFLHGGLLHLAGNMLFLWIFGNNVEDARGKIQYAIFYVVAGVAATAAHIAIQPNSTVPMIGASGAVAGVMGAYLVLYPNVRVHTVFFLGFIVFFRDIQAKWMLAFWFLSQFLISDSEGVAWMAHVGGFAFGVIVGLFWRATSRPEPAATIPVIRI